MALAQVYTSASILLLLPILLHPCPFWARLHIFLQSNKSFSSTYTPPLPYSLRASKIKIGFVCT